ncbi:MAG: hypothetical protein WBO46_07600, partial [Caldilineaceae bacterium]
IYAEDTDYADFYPCYQRSLVAIFKSVTHPDWTQPAMKIGTQIYAEDTDYADFYPCLSAFISGYF